MNICSQLKFSQYTKLELLYKFSILIVAVSIPISDALTRVSIVCMLLTWLLNKHYTNICLAFNYRTIVFFLFYFCFVAGMLYTEDNNHGWFQLGQKLSLVVFPLLLATTPKLSYAFIHKTLLGFVFSNFIAALICLFLGIRLNYLYNGLNDIQINLITNQTLSGYIGSHSTYLSIFTVFSIFILLYNLFFNRYSLVVKIITSAIILFFLFFLLLLAARVVILSFVLIILSAFIFSVFKKKMNMKIWLAVSFGVIICTAIVFQNNYFSVRFKQIYTFNKADLIGSNNENGVTQRIFLWQNYLEVIEKNLLLGVGTGDANIEMDYQYEKLLKDNPGFPPSVVAAISSFESRNLNAHNQSIQILMTNGIIGLTMFLICCGFCLFSAYQQKQYLLGTFIILFFLSSLTESLLDRQSGIVFFSFFSALFLSHGVAKNLYISTSEA